MKISELIDSLETIKAASGDLRVVVYSLKSDIPFAVANADCWEHRTAKKTGRQRQERLFTHDPKTTEGDRCVVIGDDIPF